MEEVTCEPKGNCNYNDILFRGLTATWLAFTGLLIPETYDTILPYLKASAVGAAASCDGLGNNSCPTSWYESKYSGANGMEQQISASQLFTANLVKYVNRGSAGPVTHDTGGNSTSDTNAGMHESSNSNPTNTPITSGDKAGAGILTAVFVAGWAGMLAFVLVGG